MNDFDCPVCNGHLRVGDQIIFKVRNNEKQDGLLLLSSQIGNYSSVKHPSFDFEKGEFLEFFCPLCNSSLKSDIHENLAHVVMVEDSGKKSDVYFSRIIGEHSTYKTNGDALQISGEDAGRYTYFKIGDKFKRYL
jgi:transcription initiation factor IIE alpha subunit